MDVNQFLHAMPDVARDEIARNGVNAVSIGDGINRLAIAGHNQGVGYYFKVDQVYNPQKSEEAGYEVFEPMEQCYHIIDRKNISVMPIRMAPRELLAFNRDGECIGGKYRDTYNNWKSGRQQPGTPLRKWDVISDSEIATLEAEGIFTIEQFAEYPRDRIGSRYPESFTKAHTRAQQWVAGKEIRERAGEQATEMNALRQQNDDLVERLAKLESLLSSVEAKEEKKGKVKNKLTGGRKK